MTTTTKKRTTTHAPTAPAVPADLPSSTTPPSPPTDRAPIADDVAKVLTLAGTITTVDTQEVCDVASAAHKVVRATAKQIAAFHKDRLKVIADALEAGRVVARADVAPWTAADERLDSLISEFHVKQTQRAEAEAAAAAAVAAAEAEALRAAMVANLDAAAASATSPEVAAALRAEAEDTAAAPLDMVPTHHATPARSAPVKIAGQSVVMSHEAVVTDRNEAIAAIALGLVIARYLPQITERFVEGMTPARARLARAELAAAAAEVQQTVAAPPPEVLTFDQSALDVIAKRQGAAMLYPGIAARVKAGTRYRS